MGLFKVMKTNEFASKIRDYFTQVWQELEKVTWPTKKDLTKSVIIVIVASVVVAAILGGFDLLFMNIFKILTNLKPQ